MSYTFSRRDFMKYSALTAVAVAGAGMFSGCSVSNPNRPVGKAGATLKPGGKTCEATLLNSGDDLISYADNTLTCKFKIKATQPALEVTETHFQVDVTIDGKTSYYYTAVTPSNVTLENGTGTKSLAKGESCDPILKVANLAGLAGASKVLVKYWPLNAAKGTPTDSYNDIYATWDITDAIKELTKTDDSTSTDADNT